MSNQSDQLPSSTGRLTSLPISSDSRPAIFEQFETLTRSDYQWFYGFALRISKNHHDAEDAVQDAFLAAYQHLGELKSTQKLRPWIASIVLNCARMQYRVKNRFAFSFDEEMDGESETRFLGLLRDTSTSPEDRYAVLERYTHLNSFMASLPAKLRQPFILRRIKGLNTAETAEALGVTQSLVKARLSRASAQMKKSLARHMAGTLHRSLRLARSRELRKCPSVTPTPQVAQFISEQFNEASHFLAPMTSQETRYMEYQ